MKVIILAGGFGTRLSEETYAIPKPMVQIGGKPILWHIMKIYSHYGFNDFIICLGYKGYVIKEYFANYFLHMADVTIDLAKNEIDVHSAKAEPWKVTLVDTGLNTATGGRIKRVREFIDEETFMLTYGDGVSDVNINKLLAYHKENKKMVTLSAIQPRGKFGAVNLSKKGSVLSFKEKPRGDGSWVNGGFFVLNKSIFDYIESDDIPWEARPLETLAEKGEVMAYKHSGFWRCMDTLRDKTDLDNLWNSGNAPWKLWKD